MSRCGHLAFIHLLQPALSLSVSLSHSPKACPAPLRIRRVAQPEPHIDRTHIQFAFALLFIYLRKQFMIFNACVCAGVCVTVSRIQSKYVYIIEKQTRKHQAKHSV